MLKKCVVAFPLKKSALPLNKALFPPQMVSKLLSSSFCVLDSNLGIHRIYQEISRCVGSIHTSMDGLTRLHLLMSVERMALEKYPVPSYSRGIDISYFVPTCDMYAPVTETSPLFAVDCEMCMTATNKSELTRISIVDEHMQVVYDTYVKPYNPITNYLTKYSGITKAILDPVKTRLHDVQVLL